MQNITIRKCRKQDLVPACRLMRTATNDLRRRNGRDPEPMRIGRKAPGSLVNFWKNDPQTMYCAFYNNKMIGFAGAYVNGKQWYLAWLFVHPKFQDKGIGRMLLEKVWREGKNMTHALCTFAFNPQAVGLYSGFGLAPLQDLPLLKADVSKIKGLQPNSLQVVDTPTESDIKWLHQLEKEIRGYSHPQHWRAWLGKDKFQFYIYKDKGRRVGYSLSNPRSIICPAGAISPEYLLQVVSQAISLTKPDKENKVTIWCPTSNIPLYNYLIKLGFRIDEIDIFMSDTLYLDWSRYVPAMLAII